MKTRKAVPGPVSLLTFLVLGVLVGFADSSEPSTDRLDAKQLTAARRIYVAKCAKCHRFYDVTTYNDEDWNSWFEKMSDDSKLNPDQESLLAKYLNEFRTGDRSGRPEDKLPKGD